MNKILIVFLMMTSFVCAQKKQILYNFTEIPQSLLLNPGSEVSFKGHFGIPLLSHIHLDVGFSGVSAYDIFADDGRDFNVKLREAVYSMDRNDFFSINQQLEIFSGGFAFGDNYIPNKYLSFGMYQETDFHFYFPKDYAVLAYEGNRDNIGRPFDLSDLNLKGEVLTVFHVGYTEKVSEKFTFGFRGKIYSSILNVNSIQNNGRFITTNGEDNIYDHTFDLDLELQTSGLASLIDDDNSDFSKDLKTLRKRMLFGGNLGLGVDAGFTYHPSEPWTVTASIQDLGFIRHTKDVETYALSGSYTFNGINPLFPEGSDSSSADEYWEEATEAFEDLFELDTITKKYTTWRSPKFNASLAYAFGKKGSKECDCLSQGDDYLNEIGLQFYTIGRPRLPQTAITAYYYRRLFNFLSAKVTYTADAISKKNIGLGISTNLGNVNFYIMADHLLEYQNLAKAQGASFQLGFNYIFPNDTK